MRNFIVSLFSLLIILCLWGSFSLYSEKVTGDLQAQSQTLINTSISSEDWDSAETDYRQLSETWHKYKRTASFFLDAKDINEIDSTMDKAYLYMKAKDVSNSTAEFSYLKEKFRFMYQNDTLSLHNIF